MPDMAAVNGRLLFNSMVLSLYLAGKVRLKDECMYTDDDELINAFFVLFDNMGLGYRIRTIYEDDTDVCCVMYSHLDLD